MNNLIYNYCVLLLDNYGRPWINNMSKWTLIEFEANTPPTITSIINNKSRIFMLDVDGNIWYALYNTKQFRKARKQEDISDIVSIHLLFDMDPSSNTTTSTYYIALDINHQVWYNSTYPYEGKYKKITNIPAIKRIISNNNHLALLDTEDNLWVQKRSKEMEFINKGIYKWIKVLTNHRFPIIIDNKNFMRFSMDNSAHGIYLDSFKHMISYEHYKNVDNRSEIRSLILSHNGTVIYMRIDINNVIKFEELPLTNIKEISISFNNGNLDPLFLLLAHDNTLHLYNEDLLISYDNLPLETILLSTGNSDHNIFPKIKSARKI